MAERASRPVHAVRPVPLEQGPRLWLLLVAAWLIPGAGHLWLRRRHKGLTFFIVLPLMFGFGLWLKGRLFPFLPAEPLVALAALADVGIGLPNLIAVCTTMYS